MIVNLLCRLHHLSIQTYDVSDANDMKTFTKVLSNSTMTATRQPSLFFATPAERKKKQKQQHATAAGLATRSSSSSMCTVILLDNLEAVSNRTYSQVLSQIAMAHAAALKKPTTPTNHQRYCIVLVSDTVSFQKRYKKYKNKLHTIMTDEDMMEWTIATDAANAEKATMHCTRMCKNILRKEGHSETSIASVDTWVHNHFNGQDVQSLVNQLQFEYQHTKSNTMTQSSTKRPQRRVLQPMSMIMTMIHTICIERGLFHIVPFNNKSIINDSSVSTSVTLVNVHQKWRLAAEAYSYPNQSYGRQMATIEWMASSPSSCRLVSESSLTKQNKASSKIDPQHHESIVNYYYPLVWMPCFRKLVKRLSIYVQSPSSTTSTKQDSVALTILQPWLASLNTNGWCTLKHWTACLDVVRCATTSNEVGDDEDADTTEKNKLDYDRFPKHIRQLFTKHLKQVVTNKNKNTQPLMNQMNRR